MRILYCVQRYGTQIAGGAEAACRSVAEHMVRRGHQVEVVTTCALSYNDWADHFEPGTTTENGVVIHRLRVLHPRSAELFVPLHRRVTEGAPVAPAVQQDWLRTLGPEVPELDDWFDRRGADFDVVIFFTYLYATSGLGLRAASLRAPTVLHPTAHDEPAFWLEVYRPMLDAADAFACLTAEEMDLVRTRHIPVRDDELVGLGVDASIVGDGDRFRREFGLGDDPFVVYLGRIDPGKGPDELYRFMVTLIDQGRTDAKLVVVGEPVVSLPDHPGVVFTGFVDEQTKYDALAAATVFAQPSYFESFSLSLCEAWAQRRPALVQARCDVLRGQAARSGGGLAYTGLAEFDAALARLLSDPALRDQLGAAGRRYVVENYDWPAVLQRYEQLLERVVAERSAARPEARSVV
ncbi:glycosyltransferase family 4 protein [soil metagenome]